MGSFQKPIDPPKQPCSSVVDCAVTNPDPMALVLLLAAAAVLLLFVAFALAHIKTARSVLEEERERIREEAEAFATFAREVADVEAASRPLADGGPMVRTVRPPSDDGIEAVKEAYRDTVMSVPHYDAEYDESLSRNMRLEFGDDVAGAVDRGRTAHDQRMSLLDQLDTEAEALDDADGTLEQCRRTADRIADAPLERYAFDELAAEWRLLEDRREAADTLLSDRQETIQERDRENGTRRRGPSFEEYLYDPMDVTHPVLAAGTSVLDRLEEARRQVARALAGRT
jgi:hypothetical protein